MSVVARIPGPRTDAVDQCPTVPVPVLPMGGRVRRDRYIDGLRVLALVRVVTYHLFGWIWLPILFPSMGIMFALAGSLVAASLDRSGGHPWRVLLRRTRRLLPPLWLMGLVLVPVMLLQGWRQTAGAGDPLTPRTLLLWVLPLSDPPGSAWGSDWVIPLWYIRTYLWLLLLSPAFLWLLRHWPKRVILTPLVVLALTGVGLITVEGRAGDIVLTLATFGACWLVGFAHHDGHLRALRWRVVVPLALGLMAAGLGWAVTHQDPVSGWNIDDIPVAHGCYSLGAVLLLLRLSPDCSWITRRPWLDKLIALVNARAMTIYLWNNVAIFCVPMVLGLWSVTATADTESAPGKLVVYVMAWLLIGLAVLLFGWVEDLAARRAVRLLPWPRGDRAAAAPNAEATVSVEGESGDASRTRAGGLGLLAPRARLRLIMTTGGLVVVAAGVVTGLLWGTGTGGRGLHPAGPIRAGQPHITPSSTDQPAPRASTTANPGGGRHPSTPASGASRFATPTPSAGASGLPPVAPAASPVVSAHQDRSSASPAPSVPLQPSVQPSPAVTPSVAPEAPRPGSAP